MTTVKINEEQLREILATELKNALNSELSGWRIPIFTNPETGEVSSGEWVSQGTSFQGGETFETPFSVEAWTTEYEENDEYYEDAIDSEIEESINHQINNLEDDVFKEEKYELI